MLSAIRDSLRAPSTGMTWPQLAASVVFVIVVALMFRQIQKMIAGDL